MAAAEATGQQRACGLRLQAGTRSVAGELLVVRGGLQLHLDPDRRLRSCSRSGSPSADRRCGGRGRSSSSGRCPSRCASRSSRASIRSPARCISGPSASRSDFTSWMAGWIMVVGSIVTSRRWPSTWQVDPAAGLDVVPDPRRQGRRGDLPDLGRGPERDPARRDPRRLHDHRQHDRRQADGADQQRRRHPRAHRRDAADHPAAVPLQPRPRHRVQHPAASARATNGGTSAPSSSAGS